MGTRKKKDRRKAQRAANPTVRRQVNPRWFEAFKVMDPHCLEQLVKEGYQWSSGPRSCFKSVRIGNETRELPPLEVVANGCPVMLVLFHEEARPDCAAKWKEMGVLVEESPVSLENFTVYPALVPTELVPEDHRGHIVSLSSPGFDRRKLQVLKPMRFGSNNVAVLNWNDPWFDALGTAVENAMSLVYMAAYLGKVA